jgi:hypothetical protein
MSSSSSCLFFTFILLLSLFSSYASPSNSTSETVPLRPQREIQKMKLIRKQLQKINKPAIKTIHSSDGDTIDCVPSHHQPAFDHPLLQGQRPMVFTFFFFFDKKFTFSCSSYNYYNLKSL